MTLYDKWTNMVTEFVKTKGEVAFWNEYKNVELKIYKDILENKKFSFVSTVSDLSKEYDIDVEKISSDEILEFKIDVEKLYFNMLDSKADYLYNLPEWKNILSEEKIKEITINWRSSKTLVNKVKIGRNEPCVCGSGKKYKNCCGK